jgi:two-component system cell cycle sensor histidine kinase/response regulator CckA
LLRHWGSNNLDSIQRPARLGRANLWGLTLVFYVTQTAVVVRQQRIKSDAIAIRTAQAQKMEAIGKLAGGVAHDFNNLLTIILGNLDLMKEVPDPEARTELLEDARLAALRGAKVVRQLLSYARQTEGTPQTLNANDLLRSVEAMCRTLIPKFVSLSVTPMPLKLDVVVDEALFVTAMLNLIKNSVDAIDGDGQIGLSVASRQISRPLACIPGQLLPVGQFVEFSVSDTGIGIPSEDMGRVADPFFTTKAVGKGSGLGLSMVAGFAVNFGGGLEIRSDENGTVVSLILPAKA